MSQTCCLKYGKPFVEGCCVLLLSRSGAMKLSATVFRLSGLGFSGLVLFSRRVKVRGSFTKDRQHKNRLLYHSLTTVQMAKVNN